MLSKLATIGDKVSEAAKKGERYFKETKTPAPVPSGTSQGRTVAPVARTTTTQSTQKAVLW